MDSIPPPDDSFYALTPEQSGFFKAQTGIQDDEELKQHVLHVQKKAYEFAPYPCIRFFGFLEFSMGKLPVYPQLLKIGREREDAVFLDIAACFGVDARRAVYDGFPAKNVIISDIRPELLEMGHELFRTTPATYPIHHFAADAFDPAMLEVVSPAYETPSTPRPDLNTLTSLNSLHGHVSAIYAGMFFHVFDEAQQQHLAHALAGLLSPIPGSMIFGRHKGSSVKAIKSVTSIGSSGLMFYHSPDSWIEMWENVFEKGMVDVQVELKTLPTVGGDLDLLDWSAIRL
ncbi:hypothetical protein CONPUDRAFT_52099 [Coniophora puteana RWD-64-598 SS2]|uniref:Methyltransferase domain-containing protein n=1 Tax=Coniophora puteana (strain RWD-64-598) TaxID=741705 RepID=A0A5M3MXJ5_CONPW|nr:uncharacterized protein CONPUDRAFT_52099 [Coniophora puteana RWD-64-598 SS2]EIW83445.1 hypothetical protein CONPUDRAFT_52099 [Coniophora puteana RWD-64-598 SS2]